MIAVIARAEFRRLFLSPLAWSILAVSQFVLALLFLVFVESFLTEIQPAYAGQSGAPGVTDAVGSPLFFWAAFIMLAIMPLLTMRLIADERQNGTLSLLISAPVSSAQIVLGKYLGLLGFIGVMIAMVMLMPVSLAAGTSLDWGKLAASALGLLLLLGSFGAAGLYLSSLTQQPLVAAVSSFGLLLFLVVLYISGSTQSSASELFVYLSHYGHFLSFLQGMFDTSDLAYYLLFIATFLVLTIRRLDNERLQR